MAATIQKQVVQAFVIVKEEEIAASIDIAFETIFEQRERTTMNNNSSRRKSWI
jgi:hypothetical protein